MNYVSVALKGTTLVLIDAIVIALSVVLLVGQTSGAGGDLIMIGLCVMATVFALLSVAAMGFYHERKASRCVARAAVASVGACALTALAQAAGSQSLHDITLLAAAITGAIFFIMILRVFADQLIARGARRHRVIILADPQDEIPFRALSERPDIEICEVLRLDREQGELCEAQFEQLSQSVLRHQASDVVIAHQLDADANLARRLVALRLAGKQVRTFPSFIGEILGWLPHDRAETFREVMLGRRRRSAVSRVAKRALDILVSAALLVLLAPLLAMLALLVRLEDGGPAIYAQERIGKDGVPFRLFKFRSMRVDAEADGRARWASSSDSRITRLGAVVRPTRLDELPQLVNVLLGEMSLVGPRPERAEFVELLKAQLPVYDIRHTMRPGLTGWAQVNFPYGATFEDAVRKTEYEMFYIARGSFLLDCYILLQTIRVVLFSEGGR